MDRSTDDKRADEPRDLAGVSGGLDLGGGPDRAAKRDEWQESGTEDPAFFIKPSEGE
jgi:hypothetical protein